MKSWAARQEPGEGTWPHLYGSEAPAELHSAWQAWGTAGTAASWQLGWFGMAVAECAGFVGFLSLNRFGTRLHKRLCLSLV